MTKPTRLNLGPNETAVHQGACTIFAALAGAGKVNDDNAAELIKHCVDLSTRIAIAAEHRVSEGDEVFDDKQDMGGGISILR